MKKALSESASNLKLQSWTSSLSKTKKQQQIQAIANQSKNVKAKLLEAAFSREERKVNNPDVIAQQRAIAYQNNNLDTYIGKMQHYRKMQQDKFLGAQRGKVITVSDI